MELLAGDIGGTNTRLAIFQTGDGATFEAISEQIFPSRDFQTLEQILKTFLQAEQTDVTRACFGIAGPIIDQTCDATNLPWRISAASIRNEFGFQNCWLLNDLEANAWGIGALAEEDFHTLNTGQPGRMGNASIISAGTGLGEAGLYWDGQIHRPFSSEGGHTDFSPSNRLEFDLHAYLAEQYGHVSWERLVSGPGLENIHAFLRHYHTSHGTRMAAAEDKSIGQPPRPFQKLPWQSTIQSANRHWIYSSPSTPGKPPTMPLRSWPGMVCSLGGGIAPKILPRLQQADFLQAFFNKGRMRHLVEAMPLRVILNDKAALLGAARYAALQ